MRRGIWYNLSQYVDEKIAQELIDDLVQKTTKTIFYCKDCGKEISYGSIRCEICNKKHNRVVERPNREELKKLIRSTPFTRIGELYGVTDNAIKKWCDKLKLPRTKREINKISDEDWEKI